MQVEKKTKLFLYIVSGIIFTGAITLIILLISGIIGGNGGGNDGPKECTDNDDCGSGGLCSGENKCSCSSIIYKK